MINDTVYPYSKGGAQRRVWEIARRLAQQGHSVHWFGMKYWDGEDVIIKGGVHFHGVCSVQELYIDSKRSIKEATYFAYKLLKPLFRENFDIIDCINFPYFPCFSAKLHTLTKSSTLVITWLEVWDSYWHEYLGRKGIFGKWVERGTAHLTSKMIAISEMTKRDLQRIRTGMKAEVIPYGVDFDHIEGIEPSEKKSDIIFVGRLAQNKNVDILIKVIDYIKREKMPDINCVIIGDGPEKEDLEGMVRKLNLENNVHMMGSLENYEDVISLMKSSKAFVFPSVREGFGHIALEANACGLPVITVRHPQNAVQDLIIDSENGYICELSIGDIAKMVLIALNMKRKMEEKCKKFAQKYSWDEAAELTLSFYTGILEG